MSKQVVDTEPLGFKWLKVQNNIVQTAANNGCRREQMTLYEQTKRERIPFKNPKTEMSHTYKFR
jgi:hypothetical protein